MIMDYFEVAKKFLFEPTKTFDKHKKISSDEAFKYLVIMSVVMAVIYSIVISIATAVLLPFLAILGVPAETLAIGSLFGGALIVATFFIVLITSILGSVIGSLWLHLWAYLLGANKGIDQTFKSVFYGQTPNYLLSWIPFVNIIVGIWSLVLVGMGLKRLHGLTTVSSEGTHFKSRPQSGH